jgi:hypothetical protein
MLLKGEQIVSRLGIDCGVTGALVLISGNEVIKCWDMPTYSEKTADGKNRNTVDCGMLHVLLEDCKDNSIGGVPMVYVERQQHNMGGIGRDTPFTAFSIGLNYGKVLACIEMVFGDGYRKVHPVAWKTKAGLKKQPKAAAIPYAKKILDTKDFLTRKKDIGRADAMLIAYHGE